MVVVLFSLPAVGCAAPGDRAAMEGAHAGDVNGAWRYVSGTFQGSEVPVVKGGPTTLVIETDRFSGVLVCNDYYGTLQGSPPGEWRIARIGATEVRCGPASVEADLHAYARALTTATSVSVTGEGSLRLHGNGADLHFRSDGDDSRAADQEQQRYPMKVSPATVQPGQQVALYFPERTMRGVGYVLERRVDDEWQLQFYLTSDGGSLGWTPDWWSVEDAEGRGWRDIGVGGSGPDHVVIPDNASAGTYRLCADGAAKTTCAVLTVAS
jgi:heat shock protein HslJ